MPKPDGSILFMAFLWELRELGERQCGQSVPINLPELGISGLATITSIAPCPEVEDGPGRVVTGTFRHSNAAVIDLQVASETKPLGTTPNHPFWSEDRHDWVQAGQLNVGERLRLENGTLTTVIARTPRPGRDEVYNLQVEGHHTYYVGQSGVLVHNSQNYAKWAGKSTDALSGSELAELQGEFRKLRNKLRHNTQVPQPLIKGKPSFQDPQLQHLADRLYKAYGKKTAIGSGSTADAIRAERHFGVRVGGLLHSTKGEEFIKAIQNQLAKLGSGVDELDAIMAKKLIQDLEAALKGF